MAFTDWLKRNVTEARDTINAEITKFKSKDLLEAIVASSAMVAYADGQIVDFHVKLTRGFHLKLTHRFMRAV